MNLYTHLTIDEREQIFLLHHEGESIRMIAEALKRSPSTISPDKVYEKKIKLWTKITVRSSANKRAC